MALKGRIQGDHIPMNKYELAIIGLPSTITITKLSGMETEIPAASLPDRTTATGGNTNPAELVVEVPAHHKAEIAVMELWLQEAQDPVSALYKKVGILAMVSNTGETRLSWSLKGAWCRKRKLPDMSFEDEGGMSVIEYTISVDDVTLLPV